ncbi:hypothetical protein ACM7L3_26625 [Pseudomonas aeruginosa]
MSEITSPAVCVQINATHKRDNSDFEIISVTESLSHSKRVHFLLVETQTREYVQQVGDQTHVEASIDVKATYLYGHPYGHLEGMVVSTMGGNFRSYNNSVKLTNGSVMIESALRGLHIGTYLFHKITSWAKSFDPSARIVPIMVIAGDAGPENRERRNKLYTNSGIRFIWTDTPGAGGRSAPDLTVADLAPYSHWPNIEPYYGFSALSQAWRELDVIREKASGLKASKAYYRKHYNSVSKRLSAITTMLNWPLCIVTFVLGLLLARGIGWYQGFGF